MVNELTESVKPTGFHVTAITRYEHGAIRAAMKELKWSASYTAAFIGMEEAPFKRMLSLKWIPQEFTETQRDNLLWLTGQTLEELFPNVLRRIVMTSLQAEQLLDGEDEIEEHHYISATSHVGLSANPLASMTPFQLIIMSERREAIEKALQTMGPRMQKVVGMRFFDELSTSEISKNLGLPIDTIRIIETEALRALRKSSNARLLEPYIGITDAKVA